MQLHTKRVLFSIIFDRHFVAIHDFPLLPVDPLVSEVQCIIKIYTETCQRGKN